MAYTMRNRAFARFGFLSLGLGLMMWPMLALAAPEAVAVNVDQAKLVKLPGKVATIVVGNPMIADVADYSEWKNFRRATGFMFAGILFALKAGLSIGGALSAWLINAYGYIPNMAQSARALLGIRLGASVFPAGFFVLGLVCLIIYPIGKALNIRMQNELTERRKQYSASVTATS